MKNLVPNFEEFVNESLNIENEIKQITKVATAAGFKKIKGNLKKYRPDEDYTSVLLMAYDKNNWIEVFHRKETPNEYNGWMHMKVGKSESSGEESIETFKEPEFYEDEFLDYF